MLNSQRPFPRQNTESAALLHPFQTLFRCSHVLVDLIHAFFHPVQLLCRTDTRNIVEYQSKSGKKHILTKSKTGVNFPYLHVINAFSVIHILLEQNVAAQASAGFLLPFSFLHFCSSFSIPFLSSLPRLPHPM